MSNQIETGCRAIIVNSKAGNNGTIVRVIKKAIGDYNIMFSPNDQNRWVVDIKLKTDFGELSINHCPQHQLKRINDYDGHEKISWEDMKDIWQPSKETIK